jgi:hypothetical protein
MWAVSCWGLPMPALFPCLDIASCCIFFACCMVHVASHGSVFFFLKDELLHWATRHPPEGIKERRRAWPCFACVWLHTSFAPQWASFPHQYTRTLCFSPYIGPHYDPVLVRMKSQCACTSSSGWGVALALFCWFNGAWFGQVAMLSVFFFTETCATQPDWLMTCAPLYGHKKRDSTLKHRIFREIIKRIS